MRLLHAGRVFSKETDEVEKVKQSYEKVNYHMRLPGLKKIWPPLNPEKTA